MVAWYWVLISIVMSNFLTVLLSDIINFENLWEDFLFTLFSPFVWIGNFPYAFFRKKLDEVRLNKIDLDTSPH